MTSKLTELARLISTVVHGKEDVIRKALVCLVSGGHLLIEDVPGVGKTTLAFALARATRCHFRRIQFTSDLLPSDILGTQIYNSKTGEFEFRKGPIFTNIVLADEINRTNPRTQSALLEAMNEKRVSQEGVTHPLPQPFMIIATQNPLEIHGTFPLPENQLDRFMMSLTIGYPAHDDEKRILLTDSGVPRAEEMEPVVSGEDVIEFQSRVSGIRVDNDLVNYLLRIVEATRDCRQLRLGASTRGAMFLLKAARAHALFEGRDHVIPDDIRDLAVPVLAHRLIRRADAGPVRDILLSLLDEIPVPL